MPGRGARLVERSKAGAGDARPHRVEHFGAPFVDVEPVAEKLPKKAAALRDPERVGPRSADRHVGAVDEGAGRVADRRKSDPCHPPAGRPIAQFVDAAGIEAAGQRDARAPVTHRDPPPVAGEVGRRIPEPIPH